MAGEDQMGSAFQRRVCRTRVNRRLETKSWAATASTEYEQDEQQCWENVHMQSNMSSSSSTMSGLHGPNGLLRSGAGGSMELEVPRLRMPRVLSHGAVTSLREMAQVQDPHYTKHLKYSFWHR